MLRILAKFNKKNIAMLFLSVLVVMPVSVVLEGCGASEAEVEASAGINALYGLYGDDVDLEQAYEHLQKAYELDSKQAAYYLGVMSNWYGYPNEDYDEANSYFEKADGHLMAQIALVYNHVNGRYDGINDEEASRMIRDVSDAGCADVNFILGVVARKQGEYEKAMEYFQKEIEEEREQIYVCLAMIEIGNMYENGEGIEADTQIANEWYEKAKAKGYILEN